MPSMSTLCRWYGVSKGSKIKAVCIMPWEEFKTDEEYEWAMEHKPQHVITLLYPYSNQEAFKAFIIFEGQMYYGDYWFTYGHFQADSRQPTNPDYYPADQLIPSIPSKYHDGRKKKIRTKLTQLEKGEKKPKGAWVFSICPNCHNLIKALRTTCQSCGEIYERYAVEKA